MSQLILSTRSLANEYLLRTDTTCCLLTFFRPTDLFPATRGIIQTETVSLYSSNHWQTQQYALLQKEKKNFSYNLPDVCTLSRPMSGSIVVFNKLYAPLTEFMKIIFILLGFKFDI